MQESRDSLAQLMSARDAATAERLCRRMIEEGHDWQFWKTQLGYVCFLNERDDEARFESALRHFEEISQRLPGDVTARTWHAYIRAILLDQQEAAAGELRTLLGQAPGHPYALIVLAGLENEVTAIPLLRAALHAQPNNVRALRELARIEFDQGRAASGSEALQTIVQAVPFRESRYGIMNLYINELLTQAEHADRLKAEASTLLAAA
jgi:tetratricopeptide (TPR) repeat protein